MTCKANLIILKNLRPHSNNYLIIFLIKCLTFLSIFIFKHEKLKPIRHVTYSYKLGLKSNTRFCTTCHHLFIHHSALSLERVEDPCFK